MAQAWQQEEKPANHCQYYISLYDMHEPYYSEFLIIQARNHDTDAYMYFISL